MTHSRRYACWKLTFQIAFFLEVLHHCQFVCCISCLKVCLFIEFFQSNSEKSNVLRMSFTPNMFQLCLHSIRQKLPNSLASCHKYRACWNSCVCRLWRESTGLVKNKMGNALCARLDTWGSLYTFGCSLKVLRSLFCKTLCLRQSHQDAFLCAPCILRNDHIFFMNALYMWDQVLICCIAVIIWLTSTNQVDW